MDMDWVEVTFVDMYVYVCNLSSCSISPFCFSSSV